MISTMTQEPVSVWPVTFEEVQSALKRIRPYLPPTPLRFYPPLNEAVGQGIRVWVKHENHNPTNSFKVRNALSVMTALTAEEKRRGIVAATRGNHGQGLAYAGRLFDVPVTICVPVGNNPEKNEAMRGYGARLIEQGRDYDEAILVAEQLVKEKGMHLVHSTNDPQVIAGAATVSLEMIKERPDLDAMVIQVGGGSIAAGALIVARVLNPGLKIYAVQAEGASAICDSWKARRPISKRSANTFADGLATRHPYRFTFSALCEGLAGFVTVSEAEIAEALRMYLRNTHNLAEGAAAAGLAGLMKLRKELSGKTVGLVLSGSNIDEQTLRRVVNREIE